MTMMAVVREEETVVVMMVTVGIVMDVAGAEVAVTEVTVVTVVIAKAVVKALCVASRTRLLIYLCAVSCTTEFNSLGAEFLALLILNFSKVN